MEIEIERKFLVCSEDWRAYVERKSEVHAVYLSVLDKTVIRARRFDNDCMLSIKSGVSSTKSQEFEYPIPLSDFLEIAKLPNCGEIKKIRHYLTHCGQLWEIDEFFGFHQGLIIAEAELSSEDDKLDIPNWIGEEVSDNIEYNNFRLAQKSRNV